MDFNIVKANIIDVVADAVVLPANSQLKEGSGVSAAIFEAAGRNNLKKACEKVAPCEEGKAVPTLAFDLNAKYIIHAVVPKWIDGEHNEYELLCSAYLYSLNIAEVMGCESIAFPLLASGNNGFDLEFAFQIAKESINSFSGTNLKNVTLVIYGEHIASIVKEQGYAFAEILAHDRKGGNKKELNEKLNLLWNKNKTVIVDIAKDVLPLGIEFLLNPKNKQEILEKAGQIVIDIVKESINK